MQSVLIIIGGAALVWIIFVILARRAQRSFLNYLAKKPKLTSEAECAVTEDEEDARHKVRKLFKAMGATKLETQRDGKVMALLPRSEESYGEVLIAVFTAEGSGTRIYLQSRPAIPFAPTDGGKNRKNIEHILSSLKG